jgi:hypothetical protein
MERMPVVEGRVLQGLKAKLIWGLTVWLNRLRKNSVLLPQRLKPLLIRECTAALKALRYPKPEFFRNL